MPDKDLIPAFSLLVKQTQNREGLQRTKAAEKSKKLLWCPDKTPNATLDVFPWIVALVIFLIVHLFLNFFFFNLTAEF